MAGASSLCDNRSRAHSRLATAVGVSKQTIIDFERGARVPHKRNLLLIQDVLEAAGVEFIDPNGGGPGVRLIA